MAAAIKFKRAKAADWQIINPILQPGQPGFVYDNNKLKIGDGRTPWNALPYIDGTSTLIPVDGTIVFDNNKISIGVSSQEGNTLVKKPDGLYVPGCAVNEYTAGLGLQVINGEFSVKLADDSHGLVAVAGALMLTPATAQTDGAMSKEDKAFIDSLKDIQLSDYATKDEVQDLRDYVAELAHAYTWEDLI